MMLFLFPFLMVVLLRPGFAVDYNCSPVFDRIPDHRDLKVDCGPQVIKVEVNLCTAKWAGFEPTTLALNSQHSNSLCLGTVDTGSDPPVIRFELSVNHSLENPCRQSLEVLNEYPEPGGAFESFSTIQSIFIKSFIDTPRSEQGLISYATDVYYYFSCRYPLEYLLNNTEIVSSSVSVATTNSNGTFISSLSMKVYNDTEYAAPLVVPETGLSLRSKIYVEVKATNLTGNFHLLLDHCFATPSPYDVLSTEKHDFFIGCDTDQKTTVVQNGVTTSARFNFEAFRFLEHRDRERSSLYLHCTVRLCEPQKCKELLDVCLPPVRVRRALEPFGSESPDSTTVTTGPIYTRDYDNVGQPSFSAYGNADQPVGDKTNYLVFAVGVVFASAASVILVLGGWFAFKKFAWGGSLPHTFK